MSNEYRPLVGITQGDSNGIGYEVIIKALSDSRILDQFTPIVYGSSKAFAFYRKTIHDVELPETYAINAASEALAKKINILGCVSEGIHVEPGEPSPDSAKAAITALARATADLRNGEIDVLVTAPINKKSMDEQGFGYTGHTEYLKKQFGASEVLMFMVSDDLKVAVVTGHIPLRDVPGAITAEKIVGKLRLMDQTLREDFGIDRPRIGVLGLNPHCGDGGLLGDEEKTVILPAVQAAREQGVEAYGPYSPDGYFGTEQFRNFDATLAMYHDQGLIPFKALVFQGGVNYTAGLPVIRTSPDHGTAFEIAGKDKADPRSMMSSIFTAIDILRHREGYSRLWENKMPERKLPYEERPRRSERSQIE